MKNPLVYLAGGIAGLKPSDALLWRHDVKLALIEYDIEALDPMRAKDQLAGPKRISTDFRDYADKGAFFTSRAIMARDFNDVRRCDALLVNLLGAVKPSMGTIMELGWAYAFQKPTIVAIEAEGNLHDRHPMVAETFCFRAATLDEAVDMTRIVLNR